MESAPHVEVELSSYFDAGSEEDLGAGCFKSMPVDISKVKLNDLLTLRRFPGHIPKGYEHFRVCGIDRDRGLVSPGEGCDPFPIDNCAWSASVHFGRYNSLYRLQTWDVLQDEKPAKPKPRVFNNNYGECTQCGGSVAMPGLDANLCKQCGWVKVKNLDGKRSTWKTEIVA